jgi:hypothetical protein
MDDDLYYLQSDFEPTTFKVAELRGVLNKHNISYPAAAKKADLVAIFNSDLKSQARKLLNAQRKVNRTSRGIVDATSSTASTQVAEDEDEEPLPTSPVKKARGRPKKTPKPVEEETDNTLVPRTKSKPRVEKSRERKKSVPRTIAAQTPATKDIPNTWNTYTEDSPFSAENPFQSGGSSPPQPTTVSKRRRTDGPITEKRESAGRRKTDNPRVVRHSAAVNVPISSLGHGDDVEAGEEFEESELLELEEERKSGKVAVLPVRRSPKTQGSGTLTRALLYGLGAIAVGLGGVYRQEKVHVGYCGVGEQSDWISKLDIPEWAQQNLLPSCEPCPPHATCYSDLRTECDKGFVVANNPLSLGGLVPLIPTCEPDGERPKMIKAVTERIIKGLRIRNAEASCTGKDSQGTPVTTPELSEDFIRESLTAVKKATMTDEEFNDLFDSSISEVARSEDITIAERDG